MKIKRRTNDGWSLVHNDTVFYQPSFLATEIGAPFETFWVTVESGKTMKTEQGHRETELFLVAGGEGTVIIAGEEAEVTEGDAIYIPPFADHAIRNDSSNELRILGLKYWEPDNS